MIDLFVEKAKKIHDLDYDYHLVEYSNNSTKVKIICMACNTIFMQTPNSHLAGHGCRVCNHKLRNDFDAQIKKSEDMGFQYISHENLDNIIFKDRYGYYNISIKSLRKNFFPNIKCAVNKTENFINRMKEIHGDNFDFSETIYETNKKRIIVKCNICNSISSPTPNNLLYNKECLVCVQKKSKFTKESFNLDCIDNVGTLYIIKCFDEFETFYKIGITSNTINVRFGKGNNKTIPYKYEIIHIIKGNPYTIWDFEKFLHKLYNPYCYIPIKSFAGKTECFILPSFY